jgi:uncharacterized glyoxalase superfamily protein PhnB
MAARPIPEGFHTVTPYLLVRGAAKLIDFLKRAFEAKEIERMRRQDGTIMHAEVRIGDSIVMMAEPTGDFAPMPSAMYLYVTDTDAVYRRAVQAGATSVMEPVDQFYGDRRAGVKDPAGNLWWIATHKEDVSQEELRKRAEALGKK